MVPLPGGGVSVIGKVDESGQVRQSPKLILKFYNLILPNFTCICTLNNVHSFNEHYLICNVDTADFI